MLCLMDGVACRENESKFLSNEVLPGRLLSTGTRLPSDGGAVCSVIKPKTPSQNSSGDFFAAVPHPGTVAEGSWDESSTGHLYLVSCTARQRALLRLGPTGTFTQPFLNF